MNKEKFDDLNERAKKLLGKKVPFLILDPIGKVKRIPVDFKFVQISNGFGMTDPSLPNDVNFNAWGKLKSDNGDEKVFPLAKIVDFLENPDKLKFLK